METNQDNAYVMKNRRSDRLENRTCKILIIDDIEQNLELFTALIKNKITDCEVFTSQSGIDGIREAKTVFPDIILLDIMMPVMDGFEVCKIIKSDDTISHIHIIMISGLSTDSTSRIKCLESGADAFLAKPIDSTELVSQVRVALRIKRAEDALRRERSNLEKLVRERTLSLYNSEERYHTLFSRAADGILITDFDGKILEANEEMTKITGYSIPEILAMNLYNKDISMTPEEQKSRREKIMNGEIVNFEVQYKRKDGQINWIEISTSLLTYGDTSCIQSFCRDITHRKIIEKSLEDSKSKYKEACRTLRLMCDTVPDMIWAKDIDKRFTFANEATCKFLLNAIDTNEPIGKNDMFFADRERERHPENPWWHTFGEICRDSDQAILDTKTSGNFDEMGNVKGKYLHLRVNKAPIIVNGEIVGIVGSGRDVTDRVALEDALAASEEKYRAVVEDQVELICRFNLAGKITFVNKAYCEYFNKKAEDLIGTDFMDLICEGDRELVTSSFKLLSNEKQSNQYDCRSILPEGRTNWLHWTDRAIFDKDGNIKEYQSIGFDITDRLELEEKVKEQSQLYEELQRDMTDLVQNMNTFNVSRSEKLSKLEEAFKKSIDDFQLDTHEGGSGLNAH